MPRSDRQPLAEYELAWLLHSALAWALTSALMMAARRPPWGAVGVVLTMLGIGVAGWVVRRRLRRQPPRRRQTGSSRVKQARSQDPLAPSRRAP
jgi:hypothetical protein